MSRRYADMTSAVNQSTAMQREMVSQQRLGNMINATAAIVAHADAKKTHGLLGKSLANQRESIALQQEAIRQSAAQHREVVQGFYQLDQTITSIGDQLHTDLDDIKHGTFANWRDGVGADYFYKYRPQAMKHLDDYSNISRMWLQVLADRFAGIIADYPRWKKSDWADDALRTGVFVAPPVVEQPPEIQDLPPKPKTPFVPPSFLVWILAGIMFFVGIIGVGAILLGAMSWRAESEGQTLKQNMFEQIGPEAIEQAEEKDFRFLDEELAASGGKNYSCNPGELRAQAEGVNVGDLDFDGFCQSLEKINKTMNTGPKIVIAGSLLSGVLGAGAIVFWAYRREGKAEAVDDAYVAAVNKQVAENQARVDGWNQHFEAQLSDYQRRNKQAFNAARSYIESAMGISMNGDLGDRWASTADRTRKEQLTSLIENEVRRPPSRFDWIELEPFVANRSLPEDLKAIAVRLIEIQTGGSTPIGKLEQ
ncbi:hypothetical protein QP140_04335 [Corynebacterium sp. UMB9976]|uniref:hypothetical protein n=1 Tax=Corynebacterium sp. UMB9976 TaxID=3046354 RepID=UPI0025508DBB|nr:hypothetical protein [Corynebacterium sp. UMB9976]MDK6301821.1 hypothetical protein [Corynebacterium sp. UMB9976]